MTDDTPRRQSRNKPPKSYRLEDEYSFLDEDASAPSGTQTPDFREDHDDDSDDFMPDAQEEEQEDDFDEPVAEGDEEDSDVEEEYSDDENGGQSRHMVRDFSVIEMDSTPGPSTPVQTKRAKKSSATIGRPVKVQVVDTSKPRTRGVPNFDKVGGKEVRLRDLFGPDTEGMQSIVNTRDQWAAQETFPLRQPGGLRRSFFESGDARDKEVKVLRRWYADIGKNVFAKGQQSTNLTANEGSSYMHTAGPQHLSVLLGAVDSPHLRTLEKGSYVSVAEAFKGDQNRRGWIFNLDARIQDAQWAANDDNSAQYLAVAVEQNTTRSKSSGSSRSPAFSPTQPYAASIQIWAFAAGGPGALREPRLHLVICTDWGAPKQLRWCPLQATDGLNSCEEDDGAHIGLIAGIWSDGRVRILDISGPALSVTGAEPAYLNITHAAFDVAMPQTVPSCLHWLSSTTLAVATAAGTVAIWTLTRPDTFATEEVENYEPKPWFYQQLADTYILTISSGWPSQPRFLSISTADGFARLYDLRSPTSDTTASIRGRTLCIAQAWHEQTQSFIMPDEHYMLKHNTIRRYYHNLYSMRSESSITRVAASPVHPAVLIGGAEGNVEATNPIGRIVDYKVIPWQQKWFMHEWRGPVKNVVTEPSKDEEAEMEEGGPVDQPITTGLADDDPAISSDPKSHTVPQSVLLKPLARMTEGYKALQPGIQHSTTSKKETNPEIGKGIAIFEERSAITALAWNPNLEYGTWAVAGMGDGLLRVEDVGV